MKKLLAFVFVFALVLYLVGCEKKQVAENPPADPTDILVDEPQYVASTQPTQTIEQETEPTEGVTEPEELDPYEEYISTVAKGEYRYEDLDRDGEQELFISRNNGQSEIVTIVDGKIVNVLAKYHLFLCEGGIIGRYGEGAGGQTIMYYKIENHEAVIVDAIMTQNDGTWYQGAVESELHVSPQNMTHITKEEALKVIEQYALLDDSIPWFLTWFYTE